MRWDYTLRSAIVAQRERDRAARAASGPRFGILTFSAGPYERIAHLWRTADEIGLHSAWIADDLNLPGYADYESWALLGALARETTRLQIGTLVSTITWRHPAFLAAQAITLDHVSGGRAAVGIGSGGPPNDYRMIGEDEWSPAERAERLAEQAEVLAALLHGQPIAFSGRHYRSTVPAMPARQQRPGPPLLVAAQAERGLQVAARFADGWTSLGGQPYTQPADQTARVPLDRAVAWTRRHMQRLDMLCADLGRDPSTVDRMVVAYRPVPDPLESLDAFDAYAGAYHEIGVREIVVFWPPMDCVLRGEEPSAQARAQFERIASLRMSSRGPAAPSRSCRSSASMGPGPVQVS